MRRTQHIHFVGIGGVGMSGIAEVLLTMGYRVSGSDLHSNELVRRLASLGAAVFLGHDPDNVGNADVVVTSSAIKSDNVEVIAARHRGVPVIPRAEMLAELMRMKYGVAVAGTHGKTTTTSMVSAVLTEGGLDPTSVIGGKVNNLGSNAVLGRGELLVAEADESDGSFLWLTPTVAVVTTLDEEHLDHYENLAALQEVFLRFINSVPFYGLAVLSADAKSIRDLFPRVHKRFCTYALHQEADYTAQGIALEGLSSRFCVLDRGKELGWVRLPMPGVHNVSNSLAAVAVGLEFEVPFPTIAGALERFKGVERRFTLKGRVGGAVLVDDYGHHPAEVRATLAAARVAFPGKRLIVAFQPHRYSRTQALFGEFLDAFDDADLLVLTEIYAAGEAPIPGVDARLLFEAMRARGRPQVHLCPEMEEMPELLLRLKDSTSVILTLGAGDIYKVGDLLLETAPSTLGARA